MANYSLFGLGKTLFEAQGRFGDTPVHDFASNILYGTSTEFGFQNPDGSITYFFGTGFEYDPIYGITGPGTVTGIKHFLNGAYVDEVSGLNLLINEVWSTSGGLPGAYSLFFSTAGILSGDDTIDARYRANDAAVDTTLNGFTGNDIIYSGAGNDTLFGGYGNDAIWGGAGNDVFSDELNAGGSPGGDDRFFGQDGDDRMSGFDGNDTLSGGNGNDVIIGGRGSDAISGNAGNDILYSGANGAADASRDSVNGGSGTDTAIYQLGWDDLVVTRTASGLSVRDQSNTDTYTSVERIAVDQGTYSWNATTGAWQRINSTSGEQLLTGIVPQRGTTGADTINLTATTPAIVYGLGGDDVINGLGQNELIFGGSGNDAISGLNGSDRLYGDAGNDSLLGGEGSDTLKGGSGSDSLNGGRGSDRLSGGTEADTFTFVFESNATRDQPLWGNDIITDFQLGVDKIILNLNGSTFLVPALSLTTDGWLLTTGQSSSTILFQGLSTAGLTLDDLTLV